MFGKFLKQQRNKYKITQDDIASELGTSRPTYRQVECGERELTVSEAKNWHGSLYKKV